MAKISELKKRSDLASFNIEEIRKETIKVFCKSKEFLNYLKDLEKKAFEEADKGNYSAELETESYFSKAVKSDVIHDALIAEGYNTIQELIREDYSDLSCTYHIRSFKVFWR